MRPAVAWRLGAVFALLSLSGLQVASQGLVPCQAPQCFPPTASTVGTCTFTDGDQQEPAASEGFPACGVVRSFSWPPTSTEANFQQIIDAGFNVAMVPGSVAALNLAEAKGLKLIVSDNTMPRPAPGYVPPSVSDESPAAVPDQLPRERPQPPSGPYDDVLQTLDTTPYSAFHQLTSGPLAPARSALEPVVPPRISWKLDSGYRWAKDRALPMYGNDALQTLTLAQQRDLDAIVAKYSGSPALAGYFVVDEPQAYQLPFYANVVNYLHQKDPDHLAFVNFAPYDFRTGVGAAMGGFADDTLGTQSVYDFYPFTEGHDAPQFFDYLREVGNMSRARSGTAHPVDFWDHVQLTQHSSYRHLTEAELRFQTMQSLAYGSRGVFYYTYTTYPSSSSKGYADDGIVHLNGTKSEHYAQVQGINKDAARIGRYLSLAPNQAVATNSSAPLAFAGTDITITNGARVTVGAFEMPAGLGTAAQHHYALIANAWHDGPDQTVEFSVQSGTPSWLHLTSTSQAWDSIPSTGLVLAPGDGILVRW